MTDTPAVTRQDIGAACAAADTAASAAARAAARHATYRARAAAALTSALLPAAATVVFAARTDHVDGATIIGLLLIRDRGGHALWHDLPAPDAARLGLDDPPDLNMDALGEIEAQIRRGYDADPAHFTASDDPACGLHDTGLLELPVPAADAEEPPTLAAGRIVTVHAPDGAARCYAVAGGQTMAVDVDGVPVLGIDAGGPGRWYADQWQRIDPHGELAARTVTIIGLTAAMLPSLAAAVGPSPETLGRFKTWADGRPFPLAGENYDLDAAVRWAREHGLGYEDQQLVRAEPRP